MTNALAMDPAFYTVLGLAISGILGLITAAVGKRRTASEANADRRSDFQSVAAEMKELLKEKKADILALQGDVAAANKRCAECTEQLKTAHAMLHNAHEILTVWSMELGKEPPKLLPAELLPADDDDKLDENGPPK